MSHNRKAHKQMLLRRLQRAIDGLYHNATPAYPNMQNLYESHLFERWFADAASDEIAYIQNGGAYALGFDLDIKWIKSSFDDLYNNQRKKGKSHAYASRYASKASRDMQEERARCNDLDSRETLTNALWEEIGHYGKLYTWGRGGRTLAPEKLIQQRGGSCFSLRNAEDLADDWHYAEIVRLTLVLESFNAYVAGWCRSVPELWDEAKESSGWQPDIIAHEGLKPYSVTVWR